MSDIISQLRRFASESGASISFSLTVDDAKEVLAEIDHLRSLAGAVSAGPSLADLKAGQCQCGAGAKPA